MIKKIHLKNLDNINRVSISSIAKEVSAIDMSDEYYPCKIENPDLTVIIRCYEVDKDLYFEAVNSVLSEENRFELLLVDDGSTTPIEKIDDDRVSLLRLQYNQGPFRARLKGIAKAKGEYTTFLDSDDSYIPGMLNEYLQYCKENGYKLCGAQAKHSRHSRPIEDLPQIKTNDVKKAMDESYEIIPYTMPTTLFSTDIAMSDYSSSFFTKEDVCWLPQISKRLEKEQIGYFSEDTYQYTLLSSKSVSSDGGDNSIYTKYVRDFEYVALQEYFDIYRNIIENVHDKIKIVYIFQALTPGGYEGRICRLANGLDKNVFDVLVLVLQQSPYDMSRILNVPVIHRCDSDDPNVFIEKEITEFNADIVHYPLYMENVIVPDTVKRYYYIARMDNLPDIDLQRVDRLIEVSPDIDYTQEIKDKIVSIPTGIDISEFDKCPVYRNTSRDIMGINDDEFIVLWSGRLDDPHKRVADLLSIIDTLQKYNNIRFLIQGYFKNKFDEIAFSYEISKYGDKIVYINDSVSSEAPMIMAAADMYLSTSDLEGFSNSCLEALAAELPIVSTKAHGQNYMIMKNINGYLEEIGDVQALSDSILRLFNADKTDFKKMKMMSKRICRSRFDLDRYLRDTSVLYICDALNLSYKKSRLPYENIPIFNNMTSLRSVSR